MAPSVSQNIIKSQSIVCKNNYSQCLCIFLNSDFSNNYSNNLFFEDWVVAGLTCTFRWSHMIRDLRLKRLHLCRITPPTCCFKGKRHRFHWKVSSENPSIPLCQDLKTGWMLISRVVYSICHPFFLWTHVGQASLSRQRMEFQSHDRIVSAELECCLTRNADPHFAVCTFVPVGWGRWQGSLSGGPPVSQVPSTHLRHPPSPNVCFWISCPAVPLQSETMNGLENWGPVSSTATCFWSALLRFIWLKATRGMHLHYLFICMYLYI